MSYNLRERAGKVVQTTDTKWNARIQHKTPNPYEYSKENPKKNSRQWFPKELLEFINLKVALCKVYNTQCSSDHNTQVPINNEILEIIEEIKTEKV